MRSSDLLRREDGNLVLVLLAAILLGGLVVVLFGQVRTGIASAERDRDFNQAIQIADGGVQSAFTYIASQDPDAPGVDVGGILTSADAGVAASLGEGTYEWRAFRTGNRSWEVRAEGTYRGSTRAIEMSMGPSQLFPMAIWGGEGLDGNYPSNNPHAPSWMGSFTGGTGSYDGTGFLGDAGPDVTAGTTNSCNINPAPSDLDQVLYTDDPDSVSLEGCDARNGFVPEFPDHGQAAFDTGGKCDTSTLNVGGSYPTYPPSSASDFTLQRGNFYCFEAMEWGTSHRLRIIDGGDTPAAGSTLLVGLGLTGSDTDHVEVYVRGNLGASGGNGLPARRQINVTDSAPPYPDAAALRIFLAGSGTAFNASGNNHAWVAAAVYAPNRTCEVRTQTTFYGSLICNDFDIGGGGGFSFWYDARTANIFADRTLGIGQLSEEMMNTTGFDWTGG